MDAIGRAAAPTVIPHASIPYPPPTKRVVAKNPGVAAMFSFFWTGSGQIYNGQIAMGIVLILIQLVNLILILALVGIITFPITWAFAIYQAHTHAKQFNSQNGIIS